MYITPALEVVGLLRASNRTPHGGPLGTGIVSWLYRHLPIHARRFIDRWRNVGGPAQGRQRDFRSLLPIVEGGIKPSEEVLASARIELRPLALGRIREGGVKRLLSAAWGDSRMTPLEEVGALLDLANESPRMLGIDSGVLTGELAATTDLLVRVRTALRPLVVEQALKFHHTSDREVIVQRDPAFALLAASWGWPWAGSKPKAKEESDGPEEAASHLGPGRSNAA